MLLSHDELLELIESGVIDALPSNVNASSIDVRLGPIVKKETYFGNCVNLRLKESIGFDTLDISQRGLKLAPRDFVLASTIETFNLPDNISAQFILRSSMARNGLEHLQAGWADAGFNGAHLTLELVNITQRHTLILEHGMRIGQMVFFKHAPSGLGSYALKGSYNGQQGPTEAGKK